MKDAALSELRMIVKWITRTPLNHPTADGNYAPLTPISVIILTALFVAAMPFILWYVHR